MKNSKIYQKQSKAKRIKILLKNYDKMWKSHQEMANFQEPIVMLIRNTKKVEWHDNATTGWFVFEHSDGTKRKVKLSPEFQLTFDYGKRTFSGYVLHEDFKTPLPEIPVVTAEQIEWAINKTQKDLANYEATKIKSKGLMWKQILIGLGILVGIYFGAVIVAGIFGIQLFGNGEQEVVRTASQAIIENATK